MTSITLHPEYGVNPTLGVCFWCGQEDGTIGLLGRNRGKEAPRRSVLSYEPCAKCKEGMALGITCMEASDTPNFEGQPPMMKSRGRDVYPTGSFSVITESAAQRIFAEPSILSSIMQARKTFMDKQTYKTMFGEADAAQD